jgi:molybdate transport system substrate-binding protein
VVLVKLPLLAVLIALALPVGQAEASGAKILSAGAFLPIVQAMKPAFEQRSGDVLSVDNDTVGALTKRIEGGERCDMAVLTKPALDGLAKKGLMVAGSDRAIARVGIGMAVLAGAPKPDIATVEAFKAAVLAAPSVAYIDPAAGGSSGIYLADLFKRLGIAQQVAAKAVLVPGGRVADKLVDGRAVMGIHQISEILPVKGVVLVGPLPAAIQNYTYYAAGICAKATHRRAAAAFIRSLRGARARSLLAGRGMEPAR